MTKDWDNLDDEKFFIIAMYYRLGKNTTLQQHIDNRKYIQDRLKNIGYTWIEGCCGNNEIRKI